MIHLSVEFLKSHCTSISRAKQAYALLLRTHLFFDNHFASKLLDFLAVSESGSISYAGKLFAQIPDPDNYLWNTMLRGYARSQNPHDALSFYQFMIGSGRPPDNYAYPFVLMACGRLKRAQLGRGIHCKVVKVGLGSDLFVVNALVRFYGDCAVLGNARGVFDGSPVRDVVTWNLMINAYVDKGFYNESFELCQHMLNLNCLMPDEVTVIGLASACSKTGNLDLGKLLHDYSRDHGLVDYLRVNNAILDMYCKCGDLESAQELFHGMPRRDILSWTIMISGFLNMGHFLESLVLFRKLQFERIQPDGVMLVGVLSACAQTGALELGKYIHLLIDKQGINTDIVLETSLVDMYAKCGAIDLAMQVFRNMRVRNVLTWNAVIGGLAMYGHGREALSWYDQMKKDEILPDRVTFIALLCACSHAGLVDEGMELFQAMNEKFKVDPEMEHYGCVVDLLCRARLVNDALAFIENMPIKANSIIWATLLGACRTGGHFELAERVGKRVIELEPDSCGRYVMLSNLYASKNKWEDALRVRKHMKNNSIDKNPGCSWIELNGQIYQFVAGDRSHIQTEQIYAMIEDITQQVKLHGGHASDVADVLFDIEEEEEEKGHALSILSEKLTIAIG